MKCGHCGGRLEGNLTVCPFCSARQDVDLAQIHFRDLGNDGSMPCPGCESTLGTIEFDTDPAIRIERCESCLGLFFNPGELVALLQQKTNPLVWLDRQRLAEIAENFGYNHEVVYLQCPVCRERMSHLNFGGQSGVILDRCGSHGVWVQGGELRRLLEWWRAGGKHIHQANEQEKAAELRSLHLPPMGSDMGRSRAGGIDWSKVDTTPSNDYLSGGEAVIDVIKGMLSSFFR
ncbi:zf-TFIIB domain-containing protein [Haloferula sp. A504]|uniref:TFIIB-type zinc ribbon-containing protein n=1 Tax=Haloferula sp. A504 TaxID=3373601 RepID=UPI0031BC3A54|nr:zf-TFIIB domain-containing protein [Verrucomicrobiaceae bacterium E54]